MKCWMMAGWVTLAACGAASAVHITVDGAATYQTIEGIGVNVNYRNWDGTNLQPVLDAFIDQAGMTAFRVVHDLSDWEAVNDNADPQVMDWAYYNTIYGTNEFARLWDMFAYLESRGMADRTTLCFMGWGPQWMMAADGRTLKAGMEAEWAETLASAILYARNTRGLNIRLLTPNNEPDLFDEGVRIPTATQFTNTLHRLAALFDANGVGNLWFVGPDRASGDTVFIPEMMGDPLIMSRLKRFSIHTYSYRTNTFVRDFLQSSAYPDRTLWATEFNVWCSGCDSGTKPVFDWDYTRGTAQYLIGHLLAGASGATVWEGYDSIYNHHYTNWSYWGLIGVDDVNAAVKTYTPRKHFYTVSQVSKWVRPGAKLVNVAGANSQVTPVAGFKHEALGQAVIVGINTGGSTTLSGTLASMPPVPWLELYYTTATTNLAYAGRVGVSNATFSTILPADCVFTLTGFANVQQLTNGVPHAAVQSGMGSIEDRYLFPVTNPAVRAQVDLMAPTADVTLLLRKGLPAEGFAAFDYLSANPGTNAEQIVVRPGSSPVGLSAGTWYASVLNTSGMAAEYELRVTQNSASGWPLVIGPANMASSQICFSWDTVPGATYVVQRRPDLAAGGWIDVTETLEATNTTMSCCLPVSAPHELFRVGEGVAVDKSSTPQFLLSQFTVSGNVVALRWQAPPTLRFHLEWTDDLGTGWTRIPEVMSPVGGEFQFTDDGTQTAPLGANRFYRLVLAP